MGLPIMAPTPLAVFNKEPLMFGFLKTNQDATRHEVQEEFVARVAGAAQDFVEAAGSNGGDPGSEVCFGAIAKVERRIRYGAAEAIPAYFERFMTALQTGEAQTIR